MWPAFPQWGYKTFAGKSYHLQKKNTNAIQRNIVYWRKATPVNVEARKKECTKASTEVSKFILGKLKGGNHADQDVWPWHAWMPQARRKWTKISRKVKIKRDALQKDEKIYNLNPSRFILYVFILLITIPVWSCCKTLDIYFFIPWQLLFANLSGFGVQNRSWYPITCKNTNAAFKGDI